MLGTLLTIALAGPITAETSVAGVRSAAERTVNLFAAATAETLGFEPPAPAVEVRNTANLAYFDPRPGTIVSAHWPTLGSELRAHSSPAWRTRRTMQESCSTSSSWPTRWGTGCSGDCASRAIGADEREFFNGKHTAGGESRGLWVLPVALHPRIDRCPRRAGPRGSAGRDGRGIGVSASGSPIPRRSDLLLGVS